MGREIRRVPPNWQHPTTDDRYGRARKQPMHDQSYADAKREWIDGLAKWEAGTYPGQDTFASEEWWDYSGPPPDKDYYRPWSDEEATWWQVWETVSEGTPVTPAFATQDELIDYLVQHGDEWQQSRWAAGHRDIQPNSPGYSREAAEKFVKGTGWAPSMVSVSDGKSVVIKEGIEAL